jgi:hypothetical protein
VDFDLPRQEPSFKYDDYLMSLNLERKAVPVRDLMDGKRQEGMRELGERDAIAIDGVIDTTIEDLLRAASVFR